MYVYAHTHLILSSEGKAIPLISERNPGIFFFSPRDLIVINNYG